MATQRSMRSLLQAVALLVVVFVLITGVGISQYGDSLPRITFSLSGNSDSSVSAKPEEASKDQPTHPPGSTKGNATLQAQAPPYVRAIMNPTDVTFPRLECPQPNLERYNYLGRASEPTIHAQLPRYFFALDLHQCVDLLPRLIGSILETMLFLGPPNCVLSIVEGRSDDGTLEVLDELRSNMQLLGIKYHLQSSDINPTAEGTDRIEALAELRNLALKDLVEHPEHYDKDTTVIFSNDISLCMEDFLELIHQRKFQGADQTCAMDWTYVGDNPTFYDVWIARGMTGDLFFRIPEDDSLGFAWDLFWNDQKSKSRLSTWKPFQVFSCWNGVTAFTAKPIMEKKIKFRAHIEGECFQGEPKLFAKDMWFHGYGKIAVVPSINVEYSDEASKKIKALKGYTSSHVENEDDDIKIDWETSPPEQVKCMPEHTHQFFTPWDEGLRSNISVHRT
ncbi:glycosyltransferase family 69 protein [Bipolaris oryzae ATCC 44560]|uniref:Glycosyltransferase family 69 protein n=1 Tax=Bipolaris oryzae ATCC 44560 TaxID=930090 RepID=W6ZBC5_COCMI|nr:glycosyltransferase family 69 protein [Bipolaris oryzae ATCC 44560]EUC47118.1 glycosyltransferase family 69 protein [Bipolaris oryzae ATCC 44560]